MDKTARNYKGEPIKAQHQMVVNIYNNVKEAMAQYDAMGVTAYRLSVAAGKKGGFLSDFVKTHRMDIGIVFATELADMLNLNFLELISICEVEDIHDAVMASPLH